jgi:hypothetical protein
MNVLILTPDAVGSTLLQRLITIYMQFHKYDRPVINLHELTNGIVKYHNDKFGQEVLGKKNDAWGYYQSLEQIVNLLDSVDHYKTSRLAHYHILSRQDSIDQQIPFYQYLNDNFYIISCRRHNVFEHALSWGLNKVTKKLNVYSGDEKIDTFFDLYQSGIDLDPNSLLYTLNSYRDYVHWCNNHFNVANYFYYDEHLPNIEKYILSLPIFGQNTRLTWNDNFDIDFDTWNKCHYLNSDLGTLALDNPEKFAQLTHEKQQLLQLSHDENQSTVENKSLSLMGSNSIIKNLNNLLPATHQEFLNQHNKIYVKSRESIENMVESGILVSPPPIKKQTLAEKKHIIKNYNHLLEVYNKWILANPDMGLPLDTSTLDHFAQLERNHWNPTANLSEQSRLDQKNN